MSAYLLDTNHASALFRHLPRMEARLRSSPGSMELLICRPSIGELWFMIFNSIRVQSNERDLRRFLRNFSCLEFDGVTAEEFGRIKAELRRIGRPIPDIDIQIAAIARINNLVLLSADKHFSFVSGLTVENWL